MVGVTIIFPVVTNIHVNNKRNLHSEFKGYLVSFSLSFLGILNLS
jgi:hypothetical protein